MAGGIREYAIQATTLRDWFWIPTVDGIGWTLEVQLKMYIVRFLLSRVRQFSMLT